MRIICSEGYWRGITAIKKLANTAKVSEYVAQRLLKRQALWQIISYLFQFMINSIRSICTVGDNGVVGSSNTSFNY